MNDNKTITQQDIDEAEVRLRPILGIAPRSYIAAIYGAAILLALFLILVFPGLKKPGSTYSFSVDPPGSAVYIDGAYRGSSPCDVFLASGERAIKVERPGFSSFEGTVASKGRAFGTLLYKPRASLSISLSPSPDARVLEEGARRFSSWALAGSPSEAYQIPMDLSDAARAASVAPESLDAGGLAGAAVSYSMHAQSLRDAARAVSIAYGASAAVTPASLGRLVSALASELAGDPAMLAAFASSAPPEARAAIESSAAYRALQKRTISAAAAAGPGAGASSIVGGEEFVAMRAGLSIVAAASSPPAAISLEPFLIASSETTVGRFRRFVAARPEWGPAAAATLAAEGAAEAEYLRGFDEADDADTLRYVSRPAALAYCAWLSESAPRGYRYALPSEAQWAYAAASAGAPVSANASFADSGATGPERPRSLPYDAAGLKGMLGNVWEWCSDSYAAHPAAGELARRRFSSPEAVVRGGSWANRSDLVSLDSRGPMRESACSAYLGFRVALVPVAE